MANPPLGTFKADRGECLEINNYQKWIYGGGGDSDVGTVFAFDWAFSKARACKRKRMQALGFFCSVISILIVIA
ncbi:hypothetical protein D3C78_874930 [compost metagenome]